MPRPQMLCGFALSAALLVACASLEDQPPAKPITPMPGLGAATLAVAARNEQACAWFAHGLLLTHAFGHEEAARGMAYPHTGRLEQAKGELATVERLRVLPTVQRTTVYDEPIPAQFQGLAQLAELRGAREESRRQTELAHAAWEGAEGAGLPRV